MESRRRNRKTSKIKSFYTAEGRLRSNLTEEEFEQWVRHWYKDLIKCKNFTCRHDSDNCGIAYMCGFCSMYKTYKYGSYASAFKTVTEYCNPLNHFEEKDWKGMLPKKACIECSGGSGCETYVVFEKELNKIGLTLEEAKQKYSKFLKGGYFQYCKSWCSIYNNFMERKGYYVDRTYARRYENDSDARALIGSVSEKDYWDFHINKGNVIKEVKKIVEELHG